MEGMADPTTGEPANCVYQGPEEEEKVELGGYSNRLNPFTHFHSLLDVGECSEDDVPITELKKDLKVEKNTPNFSYISPDLCSAGVTGQCPEGAPTGAAAADEWLAEVVPQILESPAYKKDGLLIVTFGGVNPPAPVAEGETPPPAAPNPLKTGARAGVQVHHQGLQRRRSLQPVLAAALERGTVRAEPDGEGRRQDDEDVRAGTARRKRRRTESGPAAVPRSFLTTFRDESC